MGPRCSLELVGTADVITSSWELTLAVQPVANRFTDRVVPTDNVCLVTSGL
jgi:hypothetical protein